MPRTIETTVYTFDELDERARERARDWYRQTADQDFSDFGAESVIDDAVRMAEIIGIEIETRPVQLMNGKRRQDPVIYWRGFWSQGDGASFEGRYRYRKGALAKLLQEAPATHDGKPIEGNTDLHEIARTLQAVQRRHFYRLEATIRRSRYAGNSVHEMSVSIDVEDREGERVVPEDDQEAVADALRDFMRWIYRGLEQEWEYRNSDEVVDDEIRANEYTFDEDGNREG